MKRLLIFSLTSMLLLFTACQNEGPITSPESPAIQKQSNFQPKWIGLPENANPKLFKYHGTAQYVTVDKGGELTIDETYTTKSGKEVHAFSSIALPPGCVKKDCFITMVIDDKTGVSSFLPHQEFNFPAVLNQTFTGLDLSGLDVNKIHLYYYSLDGTWEIMECDNLIIDVASGTITVVNGKIPHFSVYGYGD